ncbi:hypothetical protein CR513_40640, partial [Mucuna pruriens]
MNFFHNIPIRDHSRYYIIYKRLFGHLYWCSMKRSIKEFETFDISLAIVDHLSKYAHILPLNHSFTSKTIV